MILFNLQDAQSAINDLTGLAFENFSSLLGFIILQSALYESIIIGD